MAAPRADGADVESADVPSDDFYQKIQEAVDRKNYDYAVELLLPVVIQNPGASLDVATMVLNGQINTRVLAACRDLQIPAVGISGIDAGLIQAHRRPPVERDGKASVDYGYVGDIDSVDADVLVKQLDNGLMPVVSPLSCDESGTVLNINADTVAAAIAAELNAEKLILLTGAAGVLEDIEINVRGIES